MSGYVLKAAGARVSFVMDWWRGYLAPRERILRDLGWSVLDVRSAPPPLAVAEQGHDGFRSWAVFGGGAPGAVYMVTSNVRTSDDRVLRRAIVVRIALGARPQ